MRIFEYKLVKKQLITPTILHITLASVHDDIEFEAGQYAAINFSSSGRPTLVRCFSLTGSAANTQTIEFAMRVRGRFTKKLADLPLGEIVKVRGPFGNFIIENKQQDVVLIAGGIGITPFLSMIRTLSVSSSKITLIYAVQNEQEAAFAKEIIEISKKNINLKVFFIVSKGSFGLADSSKVFGGRLSLEILNQILVNNYSDKDFYICGPPGFMKGTRQNLLKANVDKSNIIIEAFSQGSKYQSEKLLSWPANVYALSSLGLVVGTFIILALDIIHAMPSGSKSDSSASHFSQKQIDSAVSSSKPTIDVTKAQPKASTTKNSNSSTEVPTATPSQPKNTTNNQTTPAPSAPSNIQAPRTTVS